MQVKIIHPVLDIIRIFCKNSSDYAALFVHLKNISQTKPRIFDIFNRTQVMVMQPYRDITTTCKHKPLWYSFFWTSVQPVNTSHYDTASSGYHYLL